MIKVGTTVAHRDWANPKLKGRVVAIRHKDKTALVLWDNGLQRLNLLQNLVPVAK